MVAATTTLSTTAAVGDVDGDGQVDLVAAGWGKTAPVNPPDTSNAEAGAPFLVGEGAALPHIGRDTRPRVAVPPPPAPPDGRRAPLAQDCPRRVRRLTGAGKTSTPQATLALLGSPLDGGSLTGASVTWTGTKNESYAGYALAGDADLDGDGYADLLIGAPDADPVSTFNGEVFLYLGPITSGGALASTSDNAWWGSTAYQLAGTTLAMGGDLTGDGLPDLVIGAPKELTSFHTNDSVFLVSGPATVSGGLSTAATATISGTGTLGELGTTVCMVDHDGDGVSDLVTSDIETSRGSVYLFLGPITADLDDTDADATVLGSAAGDQGGSSLLCDQDFDGDGSPDLVIGAPGHDEYVASDGMVYLRNGPISGSSAASTGATATFVGTAYADGLGGRLATGDYNGDSVPDLVMVAEGADGTDDGLYLALGPFSGARAASEVEGIIGSDSWSEVRLLGDTDIDGDGVDDLVIGNSGESDSYSNEGLLVIIPGVAW